MLLISSLELSEIAGTTTKICRPSATSLLIFSTIGARETGEIILVLTGFRPAGFSLKIETLKSPNSVN